MVCVIVIVAIVTTSIIMLKVVCIFANVYLCGCGSGSDISTRSNATTSTGGI